MAPRSFNPPRCDLPNVDSPLPLSRSNFEQFSSSDWNQFFPNANASGEDPTMTALIDQIHFCSDNISEILNPQSLSEDFLSLPPPGFPSAGDNQKREKSLIMKEEQTHSRGKRGHSTNSHSLAERLRRERISERMRFLQHLVPGCSKITGKAVMLDEIINYVQSLQRQVEFLSMKLATVSPELNLDVQRLLSQDIFLLQAGRAFDPQIAPETPSDAMAASFLPGGSWER